MKIQGEIKPGKKLLDYCFIEILGEGGNGKVWKVSKGKSFYAMKVLTNVDAERYERFKREVAITERYYIEANLLPVIDKFLPEEKTTGAWYVMPIAEPMQKRVNGMRPEDIVRELINVAESLKIIHGYGISHRDVKPENILFYNGKLTLTDFGLVKYPNAEQITGNKKDIGAKFTMAPEMRRLANKADGIPADVYSFAKTLWIALTKEALGFDGQYSSNSTNGLAKHLDDLFIEPLEEFLVKCTDPDPKCRPSIIDAIKYLNGWLELTQNFHRKNRTQWLLLEKKIFPCAVPCNAEWTNIESIVSILQLVAGWRALNHMFYPDGGGNNISSVGLAKEQDFIFLAPESSGRIVIVKPKKLSFESVSSNPIWNYFRLECIDIKPIDRSFVASEISMSEELVSLDNGSYYPGSYWWSDERPENIELPTGAELVSRFTSGIFLFCGTRSPYNLDSSTYDARHNRMSENEFRTYIHKQAFLHHKAIG
ncbi:protein kinase [Chromobacterium vaccinii]|uniref:protein kinase domain-containing protein n=1 Tax=Chromobacterium vaccinii TaxID=1108595 RepID=UPI001E495D2D|nr:protein kinase [Chromobacterium vaccinii]MCD4487098.1 protein kinase [Chromobacterium vaccinii]